MIPLAVRALAFGAAALLLGCEKAAEGTSKPPRIGVVLRTAGDAAAASAPAIAAALRSPQTRGADIQILDSDSADRDVERINLLAAQGYNPILGAGETVGPAMRFVAGNYPKVQFAALGAVVDAPNADSVLVSDAKPAFLAGALAALASKSHRVGAIDAVGPLRSEQFEAGVRAGAHFADPKTIVSMQPDGADAIVVARAGDDGGKAGAAFGPGVARIAYGANDPGAIAYLPDPLVIASVITAQQALALKIPSGTTFIGLNDGFVPALSRAGTARLGSAALARYKKIYSAVLDHTVNPPANKAELSAFMR